MSALGLSPSALPVYAFALLPALLWGFAPVFSKRGMEAGGDTLQAALVVVVIDTVLFWGAMLVRDGFDLFRGLTVETLGIFIVAGLVGTALGRLGAFAGVKRVGASINSAAISSRPLFAALLAFAFIGEPLSPLTALGVVVLVAGLVVLALAKGGDLSGWEPRHLLFPLAAACFFAGGNVVRRFGLQRTPIDPLEAVALNEVAALVALAAYALARGKTDIVEAPHESYAYFAGSGTLTAVALLSMFTALSLPGGKVAIVDSLSSTAPLFTTLFSFLLLKDVERVTRGVAGGALLVVVGAALVTLG